MTTHTDTPWQTWHDAAARRDIDRALRDLYARLDADIASRGPTCWTSGRCCNFDAFGHRLYVTGLEIAWFRQHAPSPNTRTPPASPLSLPQLQLPAACRYQVDGKCSTHAVRPLGCRIFFCQTGTEHWQHELYEQYLNDLRELHDREALPYAYMEWRAGLIEADAALPT
ncbi:hypothetical protein ACERK3_12800 [Phycisphaerales bacterium AB-hyl4]|uniref:YkgJ family cysteine cluster protein n=1 Tax=Natronomicrosphaera hydrolytica TaxID=3242702 RepID=A0ABV4U848_9BACT